MSTLIARDYCVSSKRIYTTGTHYAALQGSLQTDPSQENAAQKQVVAGQVTNLRFRVVVSGTEGQISSVTLLKNGQETSLAVSFNGEVGNDGKTFDNGAVVAFSAGDTLEWKIVANSSGSRQFSLRWIAVRIEEQ